MADMYQAYQTTNGKWAISFGPYVVRAMGTTVQDLVKANTKEEAERLARVIARDSIGLKPIKSIVQAVQQPLQEALF